MLKPPLAGFTGFYVTCSLVQDTDHSHNLDQLFIVLGPFQMRALHRLNEVL